MHFCSGLRVVLISLYGDMSYGKNMFIELFPAGCWPAIRTLTACLLPAADSRDR